MTINLRDMEQSLQSYKRDLVTTYEQDKTSAVGDFALLSVHMRYLVKYLAVSYVEFWVWLIGLCRSK